MSPRDVLRGRGPGDLWVPPEPPEPVEGRAEDVLRMLEPAALAVEHWEREYDGELDGPLSADEGEAIGEIAQTVSRYTLRHTSARARVLCRLVPVAVVGMQEGWEAPVVVRLPDLGEAERDALRAEVARLRAAAIQAITAAWSSGYAAREYDRDNGEEFDRDYTLGEVEASEYLDEQMEVSDG